MKIDGRYNWIGRQEKMIYLGRNFSGNGYWHQFSLVDNPGVVWCEVNTSDLSMIEESDTTKEKDCASKSVLSDLLCPLDSICSAMVFASKDWSEEKVDAWIYGVAVGWEDESLADLKQKFNWSDETIDRLKTLHNNFKKLRT